MEMAEEEEGETETETEREGEKVEENQNCLLVRHKVTIVHLKSRKNQCKSKLKETMEVENMREMLGTNHQFQQQQLQQHRRREG